MANKVFHDTILYNKGTNLNVIERTAGSNVVSVGKFYKVKQWDLPFSLDDLNGILMSPELQIGKQLLLLMCIEIIEVKFSLPTGR